MKPNTLVARIFKEKYSPQTSFSKANLGNNPSYIWRSLWKARDVLTLRCRWRFGDGSKIHVMSEPWLRSEGKGWVGAPEG